MDNVVTSNTDFLREQILYEYTPEEVQTLRDQLIKLEERCLYKGWAKDMTFKEIKDAIAEAYMESYPDQEGKDLADEPDPSENAFSVLSKGIEEQNISLIKEGLDLLSGCFYTANEENNALIRKAEKIISFRLGELLGQAIAEKSYEAFSTSLELAEYLSTDVEEHSAMWENVIDIFFKSASIRISSAKDNSIVKEVPFFDRREAEKFLTELVDSKDVYPIEEFVRLSLNAEYGYEIVHLDIHDKEHKSFFLLSTKLCL